VDWGERQRLLTLVRARVEQFGVDHNAATVMASEAAAELTALLEIVPDPVADLEIAHAAGWLRWLRYRALDSEDGQHELAEALTLLAPVYQARPDAVPDEVSTHFARLADAFIRVAAPNDPQAIADRVANLLVRTLSTGDRADLDAVIVVSQQTVAAIPTDHPAHVQCLSTLGFALTTRFRWTGNRADLDAAIDASRRAVAANPGDTGYRSNLGVVLFVRFQETGERVDLNDAIDAGQQAVAATSAGHHNRPAMLAALGVALFTRFDRTGSRADLDAAIDAGQQAVTATPVSHPGYTGYLTMLGGALRARFGLTGDQTDLDAAIDAGQQAVTATSVGHPDRGAMLATLGTALLARYERTGNQTDLDDAIDTSRLAVAAALPANARAYLSNLGLALRTRYERTGNQTDLDDAIDASRRAMAATPVGHPDRAAILAAFGSALQARYERTGNQTDLDDAIDADREAATASPADYPGRAGYLSNLGLALRTRYERSGDPADLDDAIDASQEAASASPADDPGRATVLSTLGVALQARFARTGDRSDLDNAIDAGQQAVTASPAGHPRRADYLSNFGLALQARFERSGDPADLDGAIDAGQRAAAMEGASPRVRAIAAHRWGQAAAVGRRWPEAVAGFAAAAELLDLVVPRSLARGDQEYLLEQFGGLAAEATACCVHAGLPERAVELFEQGRGVLLGQALDNRIDLTTLARHPDLAARFTARLDDLDRDDDLAAPAPGWPTDTGGAGPDGRAAAARLRMQRGQAAAALDQVIAEIRKLPKLHGFLRPPQAAELLAAAAEEPVVAVTVSRFGSYALILTGGTVLDPVPLTELTPETVYDRVTAFLTALEKAGSPAAEQRLGDTLGWLWETLAAPVLERLGISGAPPDGKPTRRLWWCVSGLLSFLPVHAAGHHHTRFDAAPTTVIDQVISSYTPTIRALIHARRSPATVAADGSGRPDAGDRVIAVAVPHIADAPELDLPGAQAEVTKLQQLFHGRITVLTGQQATRDTVLKSLEAGRWAHFACHGASDLTNPSASYLRLTDYQQRPLTVVDVARLQLDDADLAFLSACSTGRSGGRLADEAIHLASAFQLAGYRHVIATLWPIDDQFAVDLTGDLYMDLASAGTAAAAATVLHGVTRRLRNRWAKSPSVWASHIHAGA
jgi:CHAT domain/Tetratricopeptide repeat